MSELPSVRQPVDFSEPVRYAYGPDSSPQEGVPRGSVSEHDWNENDVYPDTRRRFWVTRAGVVFDNLIHRGEMPVTIGVSVDRR